jgi:thioredoxin 1
LKKLLVIGGVIVVIFVLLIALSNKSNEAKLKDNPYGTDKLEQSTIDLIGNENYSNIVLPDTLFNSIQSGESVTAYFFHTDCMYCKQMTPVMMPIAKEMGVNVQQYNMLEFSSQAEPYGITSWPVLVHYEEGKEVARMVGAQPEENIRAFFDEFGK